jgi:murein DD-endopeptidase MepM/ murein hydrolase activator NlpD
MYAHIQRAKVRVGDFVKTGDVIAISGETGNLDEAVDLGYVEHHMHMEVREVEFNKTYLQSTALDPEEFMSTKLGYTGRPKQKRPCHSR